jgi:hypothetical protein
MSESGADGGRIRCRTPNAEGGTNVPAWKFELLRELLLDLVPAEAAGVAFAELPDVVDARLDADDRARLGSLKWHLVTVKLELEVRGELERVPGASPQRVRRPS